MQWDDQDSLGFLQDPEPPMTSHWPMSSWFAGSMQSRPCARDRVEKNAQPGSPDAWLTARSLVRLRGWWPPSTSKKQVNVLSL